MKTTKQLISDRIFRIKALGALKEFEESLRAFPHFRTVFNIALCHERLNNIPAAVALYQQYLEWPSEVPSRDELATKLELLRSKLPPEAGSGVDSGEGSEDGPRVVEPTDGGEEDPVPVPPEDTGPNLAVPGWVMFGTGLAAMIPGGIMLGLARAKKNKMDGIDQSEYDSDVHDSVPEEGQTFETAGWIVGGIGVAAMTSGLIMVLVSKGSSSTREEETPTPVAVGIVADDDGAALTMGWSF